MLTNHLGFGTSTISSIYKARWQVEQVYKTLKQYLKAKTFEGASKNAYRSAGATMKIPVFVSSPTQLNPDQTRSRNVILKLLDELCIEPRALGRSDYPKDCPLKEVYVIAKHCHGGIILGFEQFQATAGKWKRGTKEEKTVESESPVYFGSPWNQLEAGILFGLRLPLLIFREKSIFGGVFDVGTTEVFVHSMVSPRPTEEKFKELKEVFLKWYAEVGRHYYSD